MNKILSVLTNAVLTGIYKALINSSRPAKKIDPKKRPPRTKEQDNVPS